MEAIEQSNSTIPGGILVDALPYIDHGYDEPGVREAVRFFFKTKNVFIIEIINMKF